MGTMGMHVLGFRHTDGNKIACCICDLSEVADSSRIWCSEHPEDLASPEDQTDNLSWRIFRFLTNPTVFWEAILRSFLGRNPHCFIFGTSHMTQSGVLLVWLLGHIARHIARVHPWMYSKHPHLQPSVLDECCAASLETFSARGMMMGWVSL